MTASGYKRKNCSFFPSLVVEGEGRKHFLETHQQPTPKHWSHIPATLTKTRQRHDSRVTRKCLTMQAWIPSKRNGKWSVITTYVINHNFFVFKCYSWLNESLCCNVEPGPEVQRGLQVSDRMWAGQLWSTLTWGLPWPSWQHYVLLCPPLTDSFLLLLSQGEHPIV